jgi:hypothetical protein
MIARPALLVAALAFGAACDRSAIEPEVAPDVRIAETVLEDPSSGMIYYSHIDHWHGFPVVSNGGSLTLRKYFVRVSPHPDDHEIPSRDLWFSLAAHPELNTRVVLSDQSVAGWQGTSTEGTITGRRAGSTPMSIVVRRSTTTLYEAPPLNVVVR